MGLWMRRGGCGINLKSTQGFAKEAMKCWMCDDREADSAEHDKKRSDMIRGYGRGPYKGERAPVLYRDGKFADIQGPNSDLLKFGKSICQPCNNTHTQPFDLAYDRFC